MSGNSAKGKRFAPMLHAVVIAAVLWSVSGCGGALDLMNADRQDDAPPPAIAEKPNEGRHTNRTFLRQLTSQLEMMDKLGAPSDGLLKSLREAETVITRIRRENREALENVNRQVRISGPSHSPNIVLIVSPRLGWGDLGAYGQTKIPTPFLDGLAKRGVVFTDFYAGSPSIPASHWTIHTGYTANRSRGDFLVREEVCTLAETLWQGGYHTGFFGMWLAPANATVEDSPLQHGFDVWSGQLRAEDSEIIYPKTLWVNDDRVELPKTDEPIDVGALTVQAAITEMQRSAAGKRPFFLMVVLPPYLDIAAEFANEKLTDKNDWPENAQSYGAAVRLTDRDVGRLLAAMELLKLDSSTSVLFTALTGVNDSLPLATDYFKSTGPFRTDKSTLGEGNLRVPFIASFPKFFPMGRKVTAPAATWDLLPTFTQLTYTQMFRDSYDGVSLSPLLKREDVLPPRLLYWETPDATAQAVRLGEWKGLKPAGVNALQLYNLLIDPAETLDVAREHPEIVRQMIKPAD